MSAIEPGVKGTVVSKMDERKIGGQSIEERIRQAQQYARKQEQAGLTFREKLALAEQRAAQFEAGDDVSDDVSDVVEHVDGSVETVPEPSPEAYPGGPTVAQIIEWLNTGVRSLANGKRMPPPKRTIPRDDYDDDVGVSRCPRSVNCRENPDRFRLPR